MFPVGALADAQDDSKLLHTWNEQVYNFELETNITTDGPQELAIKCCKWTTLSNVVDLLKIIQSSESHDRIHNQPFRANNLIIA